MYELYNVQTIVVGCLDILFNMQIEKTLLPNHYIVTDGTSPVAGFDVAEDRWTGMTEIYWEYGEDSLPIEIISEAHTLQYEEV